MSTDHFWLSKKEKKTTLGNPQNINTDGLLVDIDVQEVNDTPSTHEDKQQNMDHFFCAAIVKEVIGK